MDSQPQGRVPDLPPGSEYPAFGDVMRETSVPHLLEHIIIDEQVRDESTPPHAVLVGTTAWLDEREGRARIEVNFTDDLVALRALREAVVFVNEGMVG